MYYYGIFLKISLGNFLRNQKKSFVTENVRFCELIYIVFLSLSFSNEKRKARSHIIQFAFPPHYSVRFDSTTNGCPIPLVIFTLSRNISTASARDKFNFIQDFIVTHACETCVVLCYHSTSRENLKAY